jgi:hypothetical protein
MRPWIGDKLELVSTSDDPISVMDGLLRKCALSEILCVRFLVLSLSSRYDYGVTEQDGSVSRNINII